MQQPTRNSLSVLGIIIAVVFQQALMGNSGPITYSGAMAGFTGSLLANVTALKYYF